jgi:lysophospholipase L1-like esterase
VLHPDDTEVAQNRLRSACVARVQVGAGHQIRAGPIEGVIRDILTMVFTGVASLVFISLAFFAYHRITTGELNYVTGLIFLGALSSFVAVIADVFMSLFFRSRTMRLRIRLSVVTAGIMVLLLELSLRGRGTYANYHEQNGNPNYRSIYKQDSTSRFRVYPPNSDIGWPLTEYAHRRKTNALGLPERPLDEARTAAEYRIIALGDSFTEGVGTSYESTWIKAVEKDLAAHFPRLNVTTINAGIAGNDVYFEYVLLRERLLSFGPDLVIVAINNSDVTDITIKGGAERFRADGQIASRRTGPKWEWVYAISYIFRHVMHGVFGYNYLLLSPDDAITEERTAAEKIGRAISDFSDLARERHFKILFAFHPHAYEIKGARYVGAFQDLVADVNRSSNSASMIDLLDDYRTNRIITKENCDEFYWRIDAHHNAKGYETMGKAIARRVMDSHFLDEANPPIAR